jgi:hypothetical protein
MILKLVVAVSSIIDSPAMTATTVDIDFIVIVLGSRLSKIYNLWQVKVFAIACRYRRLYHNTWNTQT